MPVAHILKLRLDVPKLTAQQLADMALAADREARRLEYAGDDRALAAREEANAIADEFSKRGI